MLNINWSEALYILKPRNPELLGPMFIRTLSLITVITPDFPGVKRGVKTQSTLIQLPSDWDHTRYKMVCAKCQKSQKKTELATPGVKRKNDLYLGSPASNDKCKSSATSNASGVGKSKLLSKGALNPYAAYSSTCATCKTKVDQGHKFCNRCAYKTGNACAICGKTQNKSMASSGGPVVQGQKFSSK
ncbi:hypothetical protein HO173_007125 [Letharia columbiana]|uniref:Cysteine-rich PDZ-binding protein n=1 Tax=Letharia columbiana TaxID=112416 RepID=A0A8H6FTI8_9LECA|nr:uncharacterized protein HO173_007125 [Letharia columbiana]KAF6234500.1 hypothetical protein HO173_007125 [Letharia columbiana]